SNICLKSITIDSNITIHLLDNTPHLPHNKDMKFIKVNVGEKQFEELKEIARRNGRPYAEYIRQGIDLIIERPEKAETFR
ncbi:MAG: hypothetical protein KKF66_04400, partial [Actinobacteria bacterium]|nr:hypothetical protein [Actinomycetota bacterium]